MQLDFGINDALDICSDVEQDTQNAFIYTKMLL